MEKIKNLLTGNKKTYSFELFPPKTEQGFQNLLQTIQQLCALKPDFISCTYGAGGGSRGRTFDIVEHIEKTHHTIGMAHLTCVLNTKEDIQNILNDIRSRGIRNILALRGDPPLDNPRWQPGPQNFQYSSQLCAFIRQHLGNDTGIGVAGFPEGHILCKDRERDAQFLKIKVDHGADFVITQLFFSNQDYFDYVRRLRRLGVMVPVIPGILPITDYSNLKKFCQLSGASIPAEIHEIFEPVQGDKEKTLQAGTAFAIRQCQELLKDGAPGIHFYCLNKIHPTAEILDEIRE